MNPITKIASMFIALCCTMVFFGQSSYADPQETIVSGPIFQNTTWSKAGSPYIVNGSVLVMSDAVLTIDAGVEVRFDAEKAISIQKGTLIARGTAAEPIKFTANTTLPQRGFWGYIQFEADSVDATLDANGSYVSGSVLQHVIVEYAGYRPQFSQESGALRVKDAAPLIHQSIVRNSGSDGINVAMGSITISQSRIDDNNGAGIYIYNDYAGSCPPLPVSITDNIVSGNSDEAAYGASFYVHAAGKLIRGNLVENNSGSGIYAASCNYNEPLSARMVVDNNVVRFNNGGQYSQHAINAHWSTVSNNEVYGNKGPGISIRDGVATRNIVTDNEGVGIELNSDYVIASGVQATYNYVANNTTDRTTAGITTNRYSITGGGYTISHNSVVLNRAEEGEGAAVYFQCGYNPVCTFTYNTVVGQAAPSSTTGGIFNHEDFISAEYAGLVMNYNNLHGNNGYEFYHDVPQASGTKDARFNWWGTTDTNRINNEIYDFIDDSSLAIVDYSGFLDTPSTDAPPAPPTGLAVALVGETFNLTWDANQEADIAGYKVFYDLDSGYPWEGKGATQGDAGIDVGNNLSFALSGLPANRDIYFTALAYDNTGEESWYAQEVVKRLPAPINLTAAPSSVNVRLDWNATNDASVTHYRITRIISGTTNFQGLAANHTDTTYFDQDTALIAGADYCYKVEALNGRDDVIITSNLACATFGKLGLYAPNSVGKSGATVIVPINIRNADGLRIGASDIWLDFNPAVVEFQSVERTPLTIDYAWAHAVESINANTNRVRISYIHNVPNQDPPELYGNGSLFWVKFQTKGADGATSPLDMQEFVKNVGGSAIQNENLTDLALEVLDGLFTVKGATNAAFILGDVDGDGVVRALDAALALRLAAGLRTPTPEELQAGDINGNGVIQAADASMILYFAGNGSWPPLPGAPLTAAAMHAQTTLFLDDVVGKAGAAVQTTLRGRGLSNVAGADFVIVYDTELVIGITQVAKAGLAATFDKVEFQDDGTGRVFISMADDVAIDSDGILLTLDVQIANGANIGDKAPLLLAEAQLNDLNGRDFVTSFADNTLIRQSGEVIISSIQANPANFDFIAITNGGDPAPQMLAIEADASISWSITANQNWIDFSQTSGSGPADVSVYVHIADLSAGTYSGEIAITAGAQTMIRQVQLVVDPENALPILQSSPASLVFSALQNGAQPASQVININNGGTGTLGWTAAATQSWINLSATSGTAPSTITISIDSRGLAVGEHTGEIQIAAGTQTVTVNIRLTIAVGGDVGRDNVVYLPLIILPLIMR